MPFPEIARRLVNAHQIGPSSVRLAPSSFTSRGGFTAATGAREKRVSAVFRTANAPTVIWHGLGFVPSGFSVLGQNVAGTVYSDLSLRATSRVIVLKASAAPLVADVLVR